FLVAGVYYLSAVADARAGLPLRSGHCSVLSMNSSNRPGGIARSSASHCCHARSEARTVWAASIWVRPAMVRAWRMTAGGGLCGLVALGIGANDWSTRTRTVPDITRSMRVSATGRFAWATDAVKADKKARWTP